MSNSLHKRQKILASILLFVYLVGLIKLPVSANPPNDFYTKLKKIHGNNPSWTRDEFNAEIKSIAKDTASSETNKDGKWINPYAYNSPVYENDDVSVVFTVDDPDLDDLECTVEIRDNENNVVLNKTEIIKNINGSYPLGEIGTMNNISKGKYTIFLTVKDGYEGGEVTDFRDFSVNELSVEGKVDHTELWKVNIDIYNSDPTTENRTLDMYFPGEKFILMAETTEIEKEREDDLTVHKVTVKILNEDYNTQLTSTAINKFTGELWESSMKHLEDGEYTFEFEAVFSNGAIKKDTVAIIIKDDEFWRLYRAF